MFGFLTWAVLLQDHVQRAQRRRQREGEREDGEFSGVDDDDDGKTRRCIFTVQFLCLQEFSEHGVGVGGRSGGLSPSSVSANQSSEILGWAKEAVQAKAGCSQNACGVEDVLQLLRILYVIGRDSASSARTLQEGMRTTWFRPSQL